MILERDVARDASKILKKIQEIPKNGEKIEERDNARKELGEMKKQLKKITELQEHNFSEVLAENNAQVIQKIENRNAVRSHRFAISS